jgi:hypothetical protein
MANKRLHDVINELPATTETNGSIPINTTNSLVTQQINLKDTLEPYSEHVEDSDIHVTTDDKAVWNTVTEKQNALPDPEGNDRLLLGIENDEYALVEPIDISGKVDKEVDDSTRTNTIFNEVDGGGVQTYNKDTDDLVFVGVNNDGSSDADGDFVQVYNKNKTSGVGGRTYFMKDGIYTYENTTAPDPDNLSENNKVVIVNDLNDAISAVTSSLELLIDLKEDLANKTTTLTDSDSDYPSTSAVTQALTAKEDLANKTTTLTDSDSDYPSTSAVTQALTAKEDLSNKKTTLTDSDTDYASTSAITSALLSKANIYIRLAQGITTGNNIQGMHVLAKDPFAYFNDWTLTSADGQLFTRTDNSLTYTDTNSAVTPIVTNGAVILPEFIIENEFVISNITGSFVNTNLFYRYFDIKDLDQRIGLVSALDTVDKTSIVNAINSLKSYVDQFLNSSEVAGSPYLSYADFIAGAGSTIQQSKYAYVTFPTLSGLPSGGKWDLIQVNDTWRLDCSDTAWNPTTNMTAATTAVISDAAASNVLKVAGSDTVTSWLQSYRNNLKSIFSTKEDISNKVTTLTNTATDYPSTSAVTTALTAKESLTNKKTTLTNTTTDYPSTSAVTTALTAKEDVSNKVTTLNSSTTNYPSTSAVYNYILPRCVSITYYVDPVNGLDTNNGTATGTAFKTLGKAMDMSGKGTYTTINVIGTAGSTVVLADASISKSAKGAIVITTAADSITLNGTFTFTLSDMIYFNKKFISQGHAVTFNSKVYFTQGVEVTVDGSQSGCDYTANDYMHFGGTSVSVTASATTTAVSNYGMRFQYCGSVVFTASTTIVKGFRQAVQYYYGSNVRFSQGTITYDCTGNASAANLKYYDVVSLGSKLTYGTLCVINRLGGATGVYIRGEMINGQRVIDSITNPTNEDGINIYGKGNLDVATLDRVAKEYERLSWTSKMQSGIVGLNQPNYTGADAYFKGVFETSSADVNLYRLSWTGRTIILPALSGVAGTSGYINIVMPAVGTVINYFTGVNPSTPSITARTVNEYGVFCGGNNYMSLFYTATGNASGNWFYGSYTPATNPPGYPITFPPNTFLIATGEASTGGYMVRLGNGETIYYTKKITLPTGVTKIAGYSDPYVRKTTQNSTFICLNVNCANSIAVSGTVATIANLANLPLNFPVLVQGNINGNIGAVFEIGTNGIIKTLTAITAGQKVYINTSFNLQ